MHGQETFERIMEIRNPIMNPEGDRKATMLLTVTNLFKMGYNFGKPELNQNCQKADKKILM